MYSTRVVQVEDRGCKKSTLNDLAYLTPLRIPLMNPVKQKQTTDRYDTKERQLPDPTPSARKSMQQMKIQAETGETQI